MRTADIPLTFIHFAILEGGGVVVLLIMIMVMIVGLVSLDF